MKNLLAHSFDGTKCRKEWNEFDYLLKTTPELEERKHVLPFFGTRNDLSILICHYFPNIKNPDTLAHEFQIYGDFVADLIVGDSKVHRYVLVEFEDGKKDSIFQTKGKKSTPDWARRFEGAYSQIVDWLWKLEDMRSTQDFQNTFGDRQAGFQAVIFVGKDMQLDLREKNRRKWRMEKTMIDSNAISCLSFNQLRDDMNHWLTT